LTEKLPESFRELLDSEDDLSRLKENAWKQALNDRLKSVLNSIITMNGKNILIAFDDIFTLYDISQGLLYKVRFLQVIIICSLLYLE
jgi:hypothetical protein